MIWANHNLRAAIKAMKDMTGYLMQHQSLAGIEKSLPTVEEIFRLQGMEEYEQWEKLYLPKTTASAKAVLLAASKGSNFGNLTDDRPKAMLEVEGRPVLQHAVQAIRQGGVRDITVVTGYKPEAFNITSVKYKHNAGWETTGEVGSLLVAKKSIEGPLVIGYGDVVARPFIIDNLLKSKADVTVVVDYKAPTKKARKSIDWARVTPARVENAPLKDFDYSLVRLDDHLDAADVSGEWIGLVGLSEAGSKTCSRAPSRSSRPRASRSRSGLCRSSSTTSSRRPAPRSPCSTCTTTGSTSTISATCPTSTNSETGRLLARRVIRARSTRRAEDPIRAASQSPCLRRVHSSGAPDEVGQRLDRLLAKHLPDRSRSWVTRAIENGRVTVSGVVATKSGHTLKDGERS